MESQDQNLQRVGEHIFVFPVDTTGLQILEEHRLVDAVRRLSPSIACRQWMVPYDRGRKSCTADADSACQRIRERGTSFMAEVWSPGEPHVGVGWRGSLGTKANAGSWQETESKGCMPAVERWQMTESKGYEPFWLEPFWLKAQGFCLRWKPVEPWCEVGLRDAWRPAA